MGLKLKDLDATETGGSSYVLHVGHAAEAIAMGKCSVALITLAGRPRAEGMATGTAPRNYGYLKGHHKYLMIFQMKQT